jgi:hypothetical protein
MKTPLHIALMPLLENPQGVRQVYFAGNQHPAPPLAYDVNFPRLELVLSGEQEMGWGDPQGHHQVQTLSVGDVLFVPSHGWNNPRWQLPVTTLSILFGKQQLGFSLLNWNGEVFFAGEKGNAARRGPRVGAGGSTYCTLSGERAIEPCAGSVWVFHANHIAQPDVIYGDP